MLRVIFLLSTCVVTASQTGRCRLSDSLSTKTVYNVGVLAFRGFEAAMKEFAPTFSDYLSGSAGSLFDPPLRFETIPYSFDDILDGVDSYDFLHANPSVFSCIESEVGATPLATAVARRKAYGKTFNLTQFGGVIFTLENNTEINTILDLRGRTVVASSIKALGAWQMQVREMKRAGLDHFQDPKQIIFVNHVAKVVQAVLTGKAEVGLARTDMLERTTDPATGELLNLSKIKLINQREEGSINGGPFPFLHSTRLYPEWPIGSLQHVPDPVAQAVQAALYRLEDHASLAPPLLDCYEVNECNGTATCMDDCYAGLDGSKFQSCDTTPDVAILAYEALTKGIYAGWRTPLPNMEVRSLQEEIGFLLRPNETSQPRCVRPKEIVDAVVCPPGHFKKSAQEVDTGCSNAGIDCYGYPCMCSPCVKAFEVDFFSTFVGVDNPGAAQLTSTGMGCAKFEVCGVVQQSNQITFRAVDNKNRADAVFSVNVVIGNEVESYTMEKVSESSTTVTHEFIFDATLRSVGVVIVEVYANKEQISESPFRLEIDQRDCSVAVKDSKMVPDSYGNCVCPGSSVSVLGRTCVPLLVLLPLILVPMLAIVGFCVGLYVKRKKREADSVWKAKPEEIIFDNPPQVLGRGTFGLVLLAQYRGTRVAIKRALPPKDVFLTSKKKKKRMQSSQFASNNNEESPGFHPQEQAPMPKLKGNESIPHEGSGGTFWTLHNASDNFEHINSGRKSHFDFGKSAVTSGLDSQSFASIAEQIDNSVGFQTGGLSSFQSTVDSRNRQNGRSLTMFQSSRGQYRRLRSDFIEEMRVLSKLRHPCITTVMGSVLCKDVEPMLVMEYMELGSLYDLLHNESMVIDGELVLPILRDIAQGLRFLHAATPTVIHGDLKAANVLVDSKFRAKVADFGLSQKKSQDRATGTPLWMAPELLRGVSFNTVESDIYSFGIILYEVFSRRDPYEGEDHRVVLQEVADPKINKRPPVPSLCPPKAVDLMKRCLCADPSDRPTAKDVDVSLKIMDTQNVDPLSHIMSKQQRKSEQTHRTEDLLFQIFPQHVAVALRDGRKVEPESIPCVTIFFSDIVGYTDISSRLSAEKVSDLLDRLYTKFDELADRHNVFKVETIGDAYMAVTNLATTQPDHAAVMARFSLDAVGVASTTLVDVDDPKKGSIKIRCGFHSGPVVASVCGSKTPRYTLIGDTVNVASRMESNSLAGQVHCSDSSAKLLLLTSAEDVDVISRGLVNIKGKGEMETFWVQARLDVIEEQEDDFVDENEEVELARITI